MHLRGAKPLRVHFRRVEHDVVHCAVPEVSPQKLLHLYRQPRVPVCNVPLMHELETLIERSIGIGS